MTPGVRKPTAVFAFPSPSKVNFKRFPGHSPDHGERTEIYYVWCVYDHRRFHVFLYHILVAVLEAFLERYLCRPHLRFLLEHLFSNTETTLSF